MRPPACVRTPCFATLGPRMPRHAPIRWFRTALLLAPCACVGADPLLPGDAQVHDVAAYALRGEYDWDRGRLLATVDVTFVTEDPQLGSIILESQVDVSAVTDPDGNDLPFVADPELGTLQIDITALAGQDPLRVSIAYEAASSEALRAWDVRAGDPATTRAVYTFSEPLDVPRWMPCQNRPDDRARFSVELRMRNDESLIGNGRLELDERDGDARRMRWAADYDLPPYLMAFAVGPFATNTSTHGDVSIGVWHRPGLDGDLDGVVSELDRMLDVFEPQLGPYPFEKYQLILLPAVGGGIEHAGISFQSETASNQPSLQGDHDLTAHELAHQWWGDLVTVTTWDDVWIKEGFASMLETLPLRRAEDQSDSGVLLGDFHNAAAGQAIRDPALAPPEKYTSGPYGRSAWLLTQLRGVVGDDEFFATVRDLLDEHAYGTISTDDMLAAFAPLLGDDGSARMLHAIDAQDLPGLTVAPGDAGGAVLTLRDPDQSLVAPVELEWRRADGTRELLTLVAGQPLLLTKQDPGDHLVIDPRDVHIRLAYMLGDDDSKDSHAADLMPLTLPAGPDALAAFAALPGVHQRFALTYAGLPPISPEQLPDLIAGLHSDGARAVALRAACKAALLLEDVQAQAAWTPVLTAAFTEDPPLAGITAVSTYSECTTLVDARTMFAADYAALESGLTTPDISYPRLLMLARFDLPPADAFAVWTPVVRSGHSLRVRGAAANEVYANIAVLDPDEGDDLTPWRAFVLEMLTANEAAEVLSPMIYSASKFDSGDNSDFIDAFVDIFHNPVTWQLHARAVCGVLPLLHSQSEYDAFVTRVSDAALADDVLELLADPAECQ